jgi:DNA-binding GntR family transcriptional regulator
METWMNEELMQVLAIATRIACAAITSQGRAALQASLDQACAVPAGLGWERRAAAHAEFFNVLADAADDPRLALMLSHGAGYAYDLMIGAGRSADGIVTNSRKRMLAHLHAGDADDAALEMEKNIRTLHFMVRLTTPSAQRASA